LQHGSVERTLDIQPMRQIPGGRFMMGSDKHYPEEGPTRDVEVAPFLMDQTPVTNEQFGRFVAETGYITCAELPPDPAAYPGMDPTLARAGSLVFIKPDRAVGLHDPSAWWCWSFGATWRQPGGPDTSIAGKGDHPVVHVAYADAEAYAAWAGKELPTEAEWEFAARGGLAGANYAWGEEFEPNGLILANYWRGRFPEASTSGCWEGTSPVGSYPPNAFGLLDIIGNVWEWTSDWFGQRTRNGRSCCIPRNPRGVTEHQSLDPYDPSRIPRKVLKGGSHLCAANYCRRYRPAARHPQTIDTSTSHIGFRCVKRAA
jgi:formylglycine-generating enzyme